MWVRSYVPLFIALSIILAITACRSTLAVPTQMHDGWRTGSLAEAGINEKPLARLADRIERGRIPNIHGILIVRGGKLVCEKYFEGYRFAYDKALFQGTAVHYDAYTAHNTMSITKAVTAATVGIAIDQVLIGDEQQRISTYFPEHSHLFDEQKRRINIGHLLTMSSGLQWNEWDEPLTSRENDLIQLFIVPDPVGYILAKPSVHEPGSYWYYSGGDVNLLGVLFERATGRKIDAFSAEHLFGPLGISVVEWNYLKPDIVYASGELFLRPRDLAKFGYLYLNEGVWNGTRVISKEWVEKSLTPFISTGGRSRDGEFYGYQWWTKTFTSGNRSVPAYVRTGWGGQAIVLFPTIDMLVIFTGGNYSGPDPILDLITEYLLPAL